MEGRGSVFFELCLRELIYRRRPCPHTWYWCFLGTFTARVCSVGCPASSIKSMSNLLADWALRALGLAAQAICFLPCLPRTQAPSIEEKQMWVAGMSAILSGLYF